MRKTEDEEAALLAAVVESDEDAPRLAYAAWLRAHGQSERAELIVLQCAGSDPASCEALLAEHRAVWERALGRGVGKVDWQRGFPMAVTVDRRGQRTLDVLDRAPIRWLWLTMDELEDEEDGDEEDGDDGDEDGIYVALASRLAADPRVARLHGIGLVSGDWGAPAVAALLASPYWGNLRSLWFGDSDANLETAKALAACPSLARLVALGLAGDYYGSAGDEGAAVLAGAPRLATLEQLRLLNVDIGPEGARALAASPHLTRLQLLDLGWGSYNPNHIGPGGAAALAGSSALANLSRLVLDHNGIGDDGLAALAASAGLPALATLSLQACRISDDGLRALAAGAGMPRLATLELTFNGAISSAGIEALAGSPRLATIETLWLRQIPIGDAGAVAIARSPHAVRIRDLNLHECEIGNEGARALADSEYLGGVESLKVSGNELDDAARARLEARFGARVDVGGARGLADRLARIK
jgi:uncharacterized protein (TIGR02996 family)